MALSAAVKKLLNNATPGLAKAKLGDILAGILDSQNYAGGNATTEDPGLMSAADKAKLDGIEAGANDYTLPNADTAVRGGVLKGVAVTDAAGSTPTKAEFDALLDSLRDAGVIASA